MLDKPALRRPACARAAVPIPRTLAAAIAAAVAFALAAADALPAHAATPTRTFHPVADAAIAKRTQRAGKQRWLRVGGPLQWRAYLRFHVRDVRGQVARATLVLHPAGRNGARLKAYATATRRVRGPELTRLREQRYAGAARRGRDLGVIRIDVTRAVRRNGPHAFLITTASRRALQLAGRAHPQLAPRLVVRAAAAAAGPAPKGAPAPAAAPSAPAPSAPAPSAPAPSASAAKPRPGIWISRAELASRPTSGPAWAAVKKAADASPGTASIADQNSDHDVRTLAAALVYGRTGTASYRAKAAAGIAAAIGTERGGRTLALGRNLASYVIAADLVDLGAYDRGLDARFRSWLSAVRKENLGGLTLITTHEQRPNNWGTMAGASRVAADVYLGDTADLARAARVFAGYLGDRTSYAGFRYGDLSWQADPSRPVGINPPGASSHGLSIDGAPPDDMRRGCSPRVPPCATGYAWEGMQGVLVQAQILSRRGYDVWNWSHRAILREAQFLQRLDARFGGWWATGDDTWQPWLLNHVYGTKFPTSPARNGKIIGFTDWTFGG
jgi:hypothetical protein